MNVAERPKILDVTDDYVMRAEDTCVRVNASGVTSNAIVITPPSVMNPNTIGKIYTVFFEGTVGSGEICTVLNPSDGLVAVNSGLDYVFTATHDRCVLAYCGTHVFEIEDVTT
jgi:hypothetical protein